MKLKFYMRGLGIGIILTTLILTISGNKEKLTNDEIKNRAMKLGMVMKEEQNTSLDEVLGDINSTPSPSLPPELTVIPEPTDSPELTQTPEPTVTPEPTETPKATETPEITPEPTKNPVITEAVENQEDITFIIKSGMSSGQVAILLYENGLVESPEKFNEYIVQEDKADVILTGTFTISLGASYEELSKMITSN